MSSESPSFVFSAYMNMLDTPDGAPINIDCDMATSPFSRAPPSTTRRADSDAVVVAVDPPSPLRSIYDAGLTNGHAQSASRHPPHRPRPQSMHSTHSSPSLLSPDEHGDDGEHDGDEGSLRGMSADAQSAQGGGGSGKRAKGKGKSGTPAAAGLSNATSNQMRRDQNRIAQREFRMRKQQHIKDLEARVEILSSDSEERQELMSLLVRSLLAENAQLRKMVKTMAAFVGEGLATSLPRIGMTLEDMHEFLTRPETESVHSAYQALKEARAKEAAGELKLGAGTAGGALDLSLMFKGVGEGSAAGNKRRRTSSVLTPLGGGGQDDVENGDRRARTRSSLGQMRSGEEDTSGQSSRNESPLKANGGSGQPAPQGYQSGIPPKTSTAGFGTAPNGRTFEMPPLNDFAGFPNGGAPDAQVPYNQGSNPGGVPGQMHTSYYGGRYPPGVADSLWEPLREGEEAGTAPQDAEQEINPDWPAASSATAPARGQPLAAANSLEHETPWDAIMEMQGKMLHAGGKHWEAIQLITYHMENYRQNSSYHLPPSLAPTTIQRGVAHEFIIDGVVQPCLRDQMILMRGKYDIMTVFQELVTEMSIPGEDPLDHRNWEISEEWMLRNMPLTTRELVGLSNRWRAQRGERLLDYEDLRRRAVPGPAWK